MSSVNPHPESGQDSKTLARIVLIFLIWRLAILMLIHPRFYFLWPEEELYRGLMTVNIVRDHSIPLLNLLPDSYAGGPLIMALVAAPFFALLGSSTFALKLSPLLFSLFALIVWFKVIRRYLGKGAAFYASLFIIFAPPSYVSLSLTALGDHYESIFLTACALWCFFKVVLEKQKGVFYPALFGFISGFSFWFAYIYGVTWLSCLIFWAVADPHFYKRKAFYLSCLFFVIGFSPWIAINIKTHFSGLRIYDTPLWEHFGIYYWRDLLKINPDRSYLPAAPRLFLKAFLPYAGEGKALGRAIRGIYLTLTAGPIFLYFSQNYFRPSRLLGSKSKPAVLWFWIYIVLMLGLVQASNFRAYYYFYPAVTCTFILSGFYLSRLRILKTFIAPAVLRNTLMGILIITSLISTGRRFSPAHAGKMFTVKGYSYFGAGWASAFSSFSFCRDLSSCCASFALLREDMNPKERHTLCFATALMAVQKLDSVKEFVKESPPPGCPAIFHNYFYYVASAAVLSQNHYDLATALSIVRDLEKKFPFPYHVAVRGMLTEYGAYNPKEGPTLKNTVTAEDINELDRPYFWRAIAEQKTAAWFLQPEQDRSPIKTFIQELLTGASQDQTPYILQGFGRQFFRESWKKRRPGKSFSVLKTLPPEIQRPIFQGVGTLILYKGTLRYSQVVMATLEPHLSKNSMRAIQEGRKMFMEIFAPVER